MKSAASCMNYYAQASAGRHFSDACHNSVILSADVSIVASAFCVYIVNVVRRVIKCLYKSTGYA